MSRQQDGRQLLAPAGCVLDIEAVTGREYQVIDVRSEAEFLDGTIPGAANIALFDEEERSMIGTLYRQTGKEPAISKGVEVAQGKLDNLLAAFAPYRDRSLVICCARGGMRSRSVVNMLARAGYTVCQLQGGYKAYRNWVLAQLNQFAPRLIVIHGLTGTGKTRVLQQLDNSIDLEDLAGHRSSLFGALGTTPSNQKTFESRLVATIRSLGDEPYFIEGESRKIGQVFIPKPLAMAMKRAILVYLNCSIETRIARIIEDYPVADQQRLIEVEKILKSLKFHLGNESVERLCRHLHRGELQELVEILLLDYYDKRYAKVMRSYRYSLELSSEDLDEAASRLRDFRASLG